MSNYQISLNLEDTRKEAEKLFREKTLSSAKSQIDALFYERHQWEHPSRKNGSGHEMIKEMIESRFLKEDSQKIMDAYFEANWENILKEAMDKAMRKAAEHKANQLAFAQAGLKNPREHEKYDKNGRLKPEHRYKIENIIIEKQPIKIEKIIIDTESEDDLNRGYEGYRSN